MSTNKLLEVVRARRAKLRSHPGIEYTVEERLRALQALVTERTPEAESRLSHLRQSIPMVGPLIDFLAANPNYQVEPSRPPAPFPPEGRRRTFN
jgi:hypothetical protein